MRVLKTMAAASLLATAMVANADPIIVTQWDYSVSSAFDVTTGGNTTFCVGTACYTPDKVNQTSLSNKLSWGIPSTSGSNPGQIQSSLEITGSPANSPGFGGGGPFLNTCINGVNCDPNTQLLLFAVPTQTFTHNNFVQQTGSTALDKVDVKTTLQLQEHQPAQSGNLFPPPGVQAIINVNFQETPNAGDSNGNCADGSSSASHPGGCPDIFVLTNNLDSFTFFYNATTQTASLAPGPDFQAYFVQVFPFMGTPLLPLDAGLCQAAGAQPGCRGFTTLENQANAVQFAFAITTAPVLVPEPSVLALFAVGLVGLGFTIRRRQA